MLPGSGDRARVRLGAILAEQYDSREVLLTDSGTSALRLALLIAHGRTRAPVALPAYGCYDIATAADGAGIPFDLYDLDPDTLSPDLGSLREALEGGARAVVVAHLYGVPADLARVGALVAEYGAILIEDAAQASGCEWRGRPAGAHGGLGVLSFGRGKGVTGGSGGGLLVNDAELLEASRRAWEESVPVGAAPVGVRDLVRVVAQWLLARPPLYAIPASIPFLRLGETIYRAPHPVRAISGVAAGVVEAVLPLVPAEVAIRRANAERLRDEVTHRGTHFRPPPDWKAGWLRYPVVMPTPASAGSGGGSSPPGVALGYPTALSDLSGFGERRHRAGGSYAGARLLAANAITIPTHRFRS